MYMLQYHNSTWTHLLNLLLAYFSSSLFFSTIPKSSIHLFLNIIYTMQVITFYLNGSRTKLEYQVVHSNNLKCSQKYFITSLFLSSSKWNYRNVFFNSWTFRLEIIETRIANKLLWRIKHIFWKNRYCDQWDERFNFVPIDFIFFYFINELDYHEKFLD